MATAAAPTFLPPHRTADHVELVDGGVWANNPVGAAVVEAVGVLNWPAAQLKVLSIGTTTDVNPPVVFDASLAQEIRRIPPLLAI